MNYQIGDALFIVTGFLLFMFLAVVMAMSMEKVLKKFPRAKKALDKVMDIRVCELSVTERQVIARYINNQTREFIKGWSEGESNVLRIALFKVNLDEYDEGVLEEVGNIDYLLADEIEAWEIEDDDLYIEVNKYVLEQYFNRQLVLWEQEGQQERADYWRSRGVS